MGTPLNHFSKRVKLYITKSMDSSNTTKSMLFVYVINSQIAKAVFRIVSV